eukprot:gene57896-biopygen67107
MMRKQCRNGAGMPEEHGTSPDKHGKQPAAESSESSVSSLRAQVEEELEMLKDKMASALELFGGMGEQLRARRNLKLGMGSGRPKRIHVSAGKRNVCLGELEALIQAGIDFVHPAEELEDNNLQRRSKMVEYRAHLN